MLKAKKWAASKLMDTRLGRSKVIKYIGEDGDAILTALDDATEKFAGKKVAKDMQKHIVKLLTKLGVLWNDKEITVAEVTPIREPVVALARLVEETLGKRPGSLEPEPLMASIRTAHDAALPVIKPHMKEKSWSRMTTVATFYGSAEFLTVFLNDPRMVAEREAIKVHLDSVLRTFDPRAPALICVINGCELPRVDIKGSNHCLGHHALRFSHPPTLMDFLRNVDYIGHFRDYLRAERRDMLLLLEFWNKADAFKSISSRSVVASRAHILFNKYLGPAAKVCVVPDDDILAKATSDLENPRSSMFAAAQERVYDTLSHLFTTAFMESPHYKSWADDNMGLEIPAFNPDRLAELAAAGIEVPIPASLLPTGATAGAGMVPPAAGAGAAVSPPPLPPPGAGAPAVST